MENKIATTIVFLSILVAVFLVGCSSPSIKIGWSETSGISHKNAHYKTFNGSEYYKICVLEGQTVTVDYKVNVEKGTLTMALDESNGSSNWQETFDQDASDAFALKAANSGCYDLQVTGTKTGGSFDISWKIDS